MNVCFGMLSGSNMVALNTPYLEDQKPKSNRFSLVNVIANESSVWIWPELCLRCWMASSTVKVIVVPLVKESCVKFPLIIQDISTAANSPSTDRGRKNKRPTATTSRRRPSTLEVSGISALADSDDDDHHQPRARQTSRYQPTPVDEDDDFSQDHEASNRRACKNKRPLNGLSVAKNRRNVVHTDDEEADLFMTQTTPPQKKTQEKNAGDLHPWSPNL